ncbi:MAG: GH1 family beta-glucosidase [Candidatus Hodarchaeota archaeon]
MSNSIQFPSDFLFGAATSSFQVEGAWNKDGKGESIWDKICHTSGTIENGDTGDVSCDHYSRYSADVKLMKELGLDAYRFSISWPRIFPTGEGEVNPKGLKFYDHLIDELIENEITPFATLYHWDLPLKLYTAHDGWQSEKVVEAFVTYANYVFKQFGDRVKHWITFNEPQVFVGHHPTTEGFKKTFGIDKGESERRTDAIVELQNVYKAHAQTIQTYRDLDHSDGGKIGIGINILPVYPISEHPSDQKLVHIVDSEANRLYLEPVLLGSYPSDLIENYKRMFKFPFPQGETALLKSVLPLDFLGINYYTRIRIGFNNPEEITDDDSFMKKLQARDIQVNPPQEGIEYSEMNWEIYPDGLYDILKRVDEEYNHPEIYITENGMAAKDDKIKDNLVYDTDRVDYLQQHFLQANKAIKAGINLRGFFIWSLLDNFEWFHGYSKRFGLIRVDFNTQERIWKKSAHWYQQVIEKRGF